MTAALPYANGSIHIGHLVEYLQADIWCRYQKLMGNECIFVCADDTHGTAIMIEAKKRGIQAQELIKGVRIEHMKDFSDFQIEFSNYSSTHSPINQELCNSFYQKMVEKKALAERSIDQLFCQTDHMFLPDRFVKGTCPRCSSPDQYGDSCDVCGSTYSPSELKDAKCAVCATPPIKKSTAHLFFELAHFQDFLKQNIAKITGEDVRTKMLEWFSADLKSWDITRDAPYFGFEIPGRAGQYFYVWVDAPMGYIAAFKEHCEQSGQNSAEKMSEVWENPNSQTEIYHFIGKDIIYFHTLFWPALLKVADYRQPTGVFVHGHLTVNGQKMSKSKGTQIQARQYLNHFNPTYLRYYFASKMGPTVDDFDFDFEDFVNRVNSDLIGKIVNLGSRSAQLLHKNFQGEWLSLEPDGWALLKSFQDQLESQLLGHFERREFSKAITLIRSWTDQANKYFDEKSPWKRVKENPAEAQQVLGATVLLFRLIIISLKPIMPEVSQKVEKLFGEPAWNFQDAMQVKTSGKLLPFEALLTRIDLAEVKSMQSTGQSAAKPPTSP